MAKPWRHVVTWRKFVEEIAFLLDINNGTFYLDISFPGTSVYFSGPAGGRSLRAHVLHREDMTGRAVLSKSSTLTGVIC